MMKCIHLRSLDLEQAGGTTMEETRVPGRKKELANLQESEGQVPVPYIPVSERKRQNNN